MKNFLLVIAIAALLGCASETEQKSLDKIADIYSATTSYSKGFSSSAGTETIRNFTAKISESDLIDSLNPNVTSANIALLVYQGFEGDEKGKYQHINVEMVNKKGDTADYTYPIDVLKKLNTKSEVYTTFSKSLMDGDASTIDNIRNEKSIEPPVGERIMNTITEYKQKYGTLISYEPFGVAEVSDAAGAAYQFQSYLVFSSGKKIPYLVVVDSSPELTKLEGFRFFE
jgi:hypothetical protein